DNIKVNGQILPNSQVFKFDRNNNTLPIVNLKKFLNDDEILVMGEHIKSFDSRYLGVINVSETKAKKVKPILTWSVK
ncbi:hypothetical protein CFT13S00388_09635, partial [Campylobacter fetus subsp. testudinum]|uniref:S26 family signal peptidase n=1 Tax=Campylobacter fetus TaxID=196 RepID=UPI0008283A48